MALSFERFVEWAEKKFGDVIVRGEEVHINSIYTEDYKHKMWCNPSGGRNNRPFGVYHCWKTDKKGSLVGLVMEVEKCDFQEALDILDASDVVTLVELEKQVDEILGGKKPQIVEVISTKLELPAGSYFIDELPSTSYFRMNAESYLKGRCLPIDKFMVCTTGEWKNRVVIPYYDRDGKLIYFNTRYIGKSDKALRYKGPDDKLVGVGKGDVIYCSKWPPFGSKMYLTEGEFDADSIVVCGLNAAAFGGKNLTDRQVELLRGYKPVICVDGDDPGKKALSKIGDAFAEKGFTDIGFIRPPKQHKDWNDMLVKLGSNILYAYLTNKEKSYGAFTSSLLEFNDL